MSDIEQMTFERLRLGEQMSKRYYNAPLLICYSGGKDSDVLLRLALNSGINFEVLHNHTTLDAPETVYHIRDTFKRLEARGVKCTVEYPVYKGKPATMWSIIPQKGMPPTRMMRFCCEILKEKGGQHRAVATGVRWAESIRRKITRGIYENFNRNKDKRIILNNDNDDKRRLVERCERQAKVVVNPIIDWTDSDIWDYINSEKIQCNSLYCEGFKRIGCIGCPMAGKHRYEEFRRYPTYERAYIRAFDKMIAVRREQGKADKMTWQDGNDVFRWWMGEDFRQGEISEEFFEEVTE